MAAQVQLWDDSNVIQAAWGQATSRSQLARGAEAAFTERVAKPIGDRLRSGFESIMHTSAIPAEVYSAETAPPIDLHIRKFCQLASHAGIKIDHEPSEVHLHDWALQIERDSIRSLREMDNRSLRARLKREARTGFEGSSIDDLVRYVIQRTFQNLDAEFQKKSPAEQEKIAEQIATVLRDLPVDEQDRIKRSARLPDLTAETLRQTGVLATLGVGVSGLVGLAGFSAYTTLVSAVAGVAGIVGIHLSFSTYIALTSTMAGLANPLIFIPMIAGGGAWMTSKANRSIRGTLYSTFVATSVLAYNADGETNRTISAFRQRISALFSSLNSSTGMHLASLIRHFPGLGNPPISARLASHVSG